MQVGDAACGSDVELARLVLQRMRHEQTLAAFGMRTFATRRSA
jgi:hypothetical protein